MKKILLSGYYGFNNAGDEAVLYAIITSLKSLDENLELTVLSNNSEQTTRLYNIKTANRWKLWDIFRMIKNSDLLISGGGSLLQDVTSKNGILYYLGVILCAQILRKPVLIYAQGIGPITHNRNRRLTAIVLNRVNSITVRDAISKKDLEELGVKKNILVTADSVLGFSSTDLNVEKGRELLKRVGVNITRGKIMGVSVRPWESAEDNFPALAEACDVLASQGWQIVFIPMHFPEDIHAAREVAKKMKEKYFLLKENYTPSEALDIFKAVDMVVGMRLHALIMAAVANKPLVAISYDPKVDRFMGLLGLDQVLDIRNLNCSEILDLIGDTWENRDDFSNNLEERLVGLRSKAMKPAKIALEILGGISAKD